MSLSARRAWIEIVYWLAVRAAEKRSLSARRAWIEIQYTLRDYPAPKVALRKESVDRNHAADISVKREASRSPQGERG